MITVRYFAAAAEAAGTTTESVEARTVGELTAAVVGRHGAELERVLARCSLLHDGARVADPAAPLRAGGLVDVLPPFAGG
ncbi:MoaD/ThiS family protein [Cellulomonas carbonis]|uniref:Molybdopterin converting factor n=1 Tax=Cellulomonas carbonis T26 TaxID=947969 RepID=A0A0A0BS49_9CELL|nr:MoaD/ThiS family protein [Cellulomonas carbonis]KGM10776.1 molybdopterin converting factor [Cellulomonas carbonis T26]GGB92618.1 putative molybdenum cofactor biosynthesis protein D2 (MoaD2) / thiamineS [Cellulomonas carbonis]